MRIIEACPICGHDLIDLVIATNTPISRKECYNCGWSWERDSNREEVVRVPFNPNNKRTHDVTILNQPLQSIKEPYGSSPCVHCSNNPRNGGSGICHCILGLQTFY